MERSFADAQQLHGHRYARLRGRDKVHEQSLLAAVVQNRKKIATLLGRVGPQMPPSGRYRLLFVWLRLLPLAAALSAPHRG